MEIVLQWLDELDDLVFAGFSVWGRLRRLCLAIALGAALGLHALSRPGMPSGSVAGLLCVAVAALIAWAGVAILAVITERRARAA